MSEEPNPDALGGQESYDAIVCGTGLKECILSGLLSVDGYKVNDAQDNRDQDALEFLFAKRSRTPIVIVIVPLTCRCFKLMFP